MSPAIPDNYLFPAIIISVVLIVGLGLGYLFRRRIALILQGLSPYLNCLLWLVIIVMCVFGCVVVLVVLPVNIICALTPVC